MAIAIVVFQGLFEIIGLGSFLAGFFLDIHWLMVTGGILVVLDDVIEISMGILNPSFPIILAVVLIVIVEPWYVGLFWASCAFKVLGIPTSLNKIFAPHKHLSTTMRHASTQYNFGDEITDNFNSFSSDENRIRNASLKLTTLSLG